MNRCISGVTWWRRCWFIVVLIAFPCFVHSISLEIAPIRLVLTSQRPISSMTVGNGDENEIAVQAEIVEWLQENGKDVYLATQDVVANPLIFRIAPQSKQILRIGLRVPENSKERSYRIFLQQLPRDQALPREGEANSPLQTLFRVGVPIFVPPLVSTQDMQWRLSPGEATRTGGGRYVLSVENKGSEHVQLTHISIRDAQGREVVNKTLAQYVLAGQASALPLEFPKMNPDTPLQIEVRSDARVPLPQTLVRVPHAQAKSP